LIFFIPELWAGATEAAYTKRRGFALSANYKSLAGFEKYFDDVMGLLLSEEYWNKALVYNVNFPIEPKRNQTFCSRRYLF